MASAMTLPFSQDIGNNLFKRASPKVVSVDFNNHRNTQNLVKKDTDSTALTNMGSDGFFIELQLGLDSESIRIQLDTGSSDFWVPADNVTCTDGSDCKGYGSFDPSDSDTFHNLGSEFIVHYVDETNGTGYFGKDQVSLPDGPTLNSTQFAVVYETSSNSGVLGIGSNKSQIMAAKDKSKVYPTFVDSLKQNGYINKVAYSVFLNSTSAEYGSILFGGIDHAKYHGELGTFSLENKSRILVNLERTYVGGSSLKDGKLIDGGYDVMFDTGSTISALPLDIVNTIVQAWTSTGFKYDKTSGFYTVPCVGDSQEMVLFQFGDTWIPVPIYTLIQKFSNTCYLMLRMEDPDDKSSIATFGDDILSQMYLVYNIEDEEISFAQVKRTNETDIKEIK